MRPALVLVLSACVLSGQTFEAETIKPNRSGSGNSGRGGSAGRVTAENNTLADYIVWAFEVEDYQLSGPEWLRTERFDLNAKLPQGAERSLIPAMLRALLVERFRLEIHRETKTMPVLALVAGKSGSKMRAASSGALGSSSGRGMYKGTRIAMLAAHLSHVLGRPVLDASGLTGAFEIALTWVPEDAGPDAVGPSLSTALQEQLGLRLEARKAPVEVLVVDRAERVPVEN